MLLHGSGPITPTTPRHMAQPPLPAVAPPSQPHATPATTRLQATSPGHASRPHILEASVAQAPPAHSKHVHYCRWRMAHGHIRMYRGMAVTRQAAVDRSQLSHATHATLWQT